MTVLEGKAAIVTGSARGIGRATAELLCAQGARVLVNDLDADLAAEAAAEIEGDTAVFAGDLTQEGVCEALVEKAVAEFGQLDIVVNNAGYTWDGIAHKMSDEQFRAMLEIHTVVPFRVLRAASPYLREPAKQEREEGREVFRKVVNVTSISGTQGNVGQVNYSAGKAALVGHHEDPGPGVGPVQGERERRRLRLRGDAADGVGGGEHGELRGRRRRGPARDPGAKPRAGGAGHRARTRGDAGGGSGGDLFLCSPWSNFVQGQVLTVNGGQATGMT